MLSIMGEVVATDAADDEEVRAVATMQRLALELLPQSDVYSAAVLARVLEVLPDLAPDAIDDARSIVRESTDQNMGAMFATLAFGVVPNAIEPPLGTLKLLRQAVAAGGDVTTVMHAYRVGHARFWELWSDHVVARIGSEPELAAVLRGSSAHFFAFIDRSCERLVDEYRREFGGAVPAGAPGLASRADVIDALLGTDAVDLEQARGRLGYDVASWHVALVLRPVAAGADLRAALDALSAGHGPVSGSTGSASAAGDATPRVLSRPMGDGAWSVWLGAPSPPDVGGPAARAAAAAPGVLIAAGQPGSGRDGFRRSHEQALDAERIARLAPEPRAGVVRHEDVELAGLLCHDRPRAEQMAADRLGVLAGTDEATARLRETLRVYLASGASKKRTAAALHVHQKTVSYRLGRCEQLLGRTLDHGQAELDAALRIHLTLHGP